MYHGIMDYTSEEGQVELEMDEGDTVFFHPLLYHGSGINSSTRFRKVSSTQTVILYIIYNNIYIYAHSQCRTCSE